MKAEKEKKDPQQQQGVVNEKIRAEQMQLITNSGENIGLVSRFDALRMAKEAGLDLVVLSEQGKDGFPIVKIMDFGKVLYEKKKKQNESKKTQKVTLVKEVKMRPKIGDHDYLIKIKQVIQFLNEGKRVKITLSFKGRENVQRDERGGEFLDKIQKSLEESGFGDNLAQEKDSKMGRMWSRVYYLKHLKK